jgi:hypothetical protein
VRPTQRANTKVLAHGCGSNQFPEGVVNDWKLLCCRSRGGNTILTGIFRSPQHKFCEHITNVAGWVYPPTGRSRLSTAHVKVGSSKSALARWTAALERSPALEASGECHPSKHCACCDPYPVPFVGRWIAPTASIARSPPSVWLAVPMSIRSPPYISKSSFGGLWANPAGIAPLFT